MADRPNPAPDAVSDVSVRRGALHLLLNYVKTGGGNPASVVTSALRELEAALSSPAPATEAQAPAAPDFETIREIAARHAGIAPRHLTIGTVSLCEEIWNAVLASSSAERIALEKRVGELERMCERFSEESAHYADVAESARQRIEELTEERNEATRGYEIMTANYRAAHQRAAEAMREALRKIIGWFAWSAKRAHAAEVAALREALTECAIRLRYDGDLHHDHGLDNRARASWNAAEKAERALSLTPSSAAEKVRRVIEAAKIAADTVVWVGKESQDAMAALRESVAALSQEPGDGTEGK